MIENSDGAQGMLIAEMWLDEVAKRLGKPIEVIRELNLYKEGDVTHYGQTLNSSQVGIVLSRDTIIYTHHMCQATETAQLPSCNLTGVLARRPAALQITTLAHHGGSGMSLHHIFAIAMGITVLCHAVAAGSCTVAAAQLLICCWPMQHNGLACYVDGGYLHPLCRTHFLQQDLKQRVQGL